MSIRERFRRTTAQSDTQVPSAPSKALPQDAKTRRQSFLGTKSAQGWLLSLPALLIFGIFFIGPAVVGLLFSFTRWDGVTAIEFIGISNYVELFSTPRFWKDLVTNSLMALGLILIQLPFALFLAIGLSKQNWLNNFFRTMFFLPQGLSVTVAALTWRFAYAPSVGLVNRVLEVIGLGALTTVWLGEKQTALAALTLSFMWWTFGFFTILFIAGLSAIPRMYYEALRLETNRWYHELRLVTVPLLRETILIAFAMAVSNAFGHALGYVDLVTGGGPAGATEILGLYAALTALYGRRLGFSSAITFTMLAIVFAAVIVPITYVARERLEFTE